jgi:hypothetical protein
MVNTIETRLKGAILGRVEGKESWIPDTEEGQKDLLSREGHMRKKIIRIAMVIALIGVMGFVFTSCA